MSVCQMDDSPWCSPGTCRECDRARSGDTNTTISEDVWPLTSFVRPITVDREEVRKAVEEVLRSPLGAMDTALRALLASAESEMSNMTAIGEDAAHDAWAMVCDAIRHVQALVAKARAATTEQQGDVT